jgi:dihydrofolate reductase
MHTSLDGFVAGPNGELDWIRHGDHIWNFVDTYIKQADTGIYGPTTFQMMESHWPAVLKDSAAEGHTLTHAQWYSRVQKVVCSRRLGKLDNPEAKLIRDNLVADILALKNLVGKKMMLFGSPGLLQSLTQLGLVDEYAIAIHPVILGRGIPMFTESERINLRLVSSTELQPGGVGLHFEKVPA